VQIAIYLAIINAVDKMTV